jgi:parallel beta-helix repeat protein
MKLLLSSLVRRSWISMIVLLAIALSQPARAAVSYYVATNGNNGNPGTKDKPLASIQDAIYQAKAGDTIFVRGGTYYLKKSLSMSQSGTANARITLRSYPGETAILDGSQIKNTNPDIIGIGGQYIDLKGFKLQNSNKIGIVVWQGKHIRILNNKVSNTQDTGIGIYESKDIVANGNTVRRSNLNNQSRTKNGGWGQALGANRSTQVTMNNNHVYNNYGEGIACGLTSYCSAKYNTVYDNFSVEMYMDNTTNSTFGSNFIYNSGNKDFFYKLGGLWRPASGIQMANESYATSNPLNNNSILNNIVVGGSYGFFYGSYDNGGGLKNTKILNNTFSNAAETLLYVDPDKDHTNTLFANNIFQQSSDRFMTHLPNTSGLSFNNNLWYGSKPIASVKSSQDIFANPLFVKPGGYLASDYQLQAKSPAIDQGKTLAAVGVDYVATKRPINGTYDIGAYEYKSSSRPPLTSPPPTEGKTVPEPSIVLGLFLLGGLGVFSIKK